MFEVEKQTLGVRGIEEHIHKNNKVPETTAAQKRLLRKWKNRSAKLHAATKERKEITSDKQLERVSLLVDYAFSTHPFYQKLYQSVGYTKGSIVTWDDYNALPTITKKDIIDNFELFQRANIAPPMSEVYTSTTSGSSGQVLTVMFDQAMIDQDMMHCMRFYEQMLGRERQPDEWLYQVYVVAPPFTSLDGNYPTFTVSTECPPETVLAHLKLMKPAILAGLPSYLERLGDLVKDPRELGIKVINTNSEASTPAQRKKLAEQFNAVVYDEYSSVEVGLIATQCENKKYHIVEDNVRVDVMSPDKNGQG